MSETYENEPTNPQSGDFLEQLEQMLNEIENEWKEKGGLTEYDEELLNRFRGFTKPKDSSEFCTEDDDHEREVKENSERIRNHLWENFQTGITDCQCELCNQDYSCSSSSDFADSRLEISLAQHFLKRVVHAPKSESNRFLSLSNVHRRISCDPNNAQVLKNMLMIKNPAITALLASSI